VKETVVRKLGYIVGLATVVVAPIAASADEPSREQLLQQIDELRGRIEQLETQQKTLSSKDIDETVERVLRDADQRSKFFADNVGLTAGFDNNKFFLKSEDGNFLLTPGFLFQTRFTTNWIEPDNLNDDEVESGFEVRRMRIIFEGHAFTPDLQYKFQWESDSNDGDVFLQDAWARYKFADRFKVQVGQFKDTVYHEESVGDQAVLTADRSFINALIGGGNIDRIQGVMLMYDDNDRLHVNLVVHDGHNTKNTNFTDTGGGNVFLGVNNLNWGVSGRVEYLASGTFKQYDDFTARGNKQDLLVLGGGVNYSEGGDSNVLFHTIDAQWENSSGLGLYGALMGICREIGDDSTVPTGTYYDWGSLMQAGYMVADKCEVFGRFEYIDIDQDALTIVGAESTLYELTIGTNYFLHGHNVKFTADLSWLPNGSPVALTGLGIAQGTDDQFVLRLQMQLFL
jgi:Phosphate-selective porin O and P